MKRYKTFCFICDIETRNTKKSSKSIDVCSKCYEQNKRDLIRYNKERREKAYKEMIEEHKKSK